MNKTSRPHDEAMVELLRQDPAFADDYLTAALDEADQPGGRVALLSALRQIAEAQGMATVAENPTIKTLLAVVNAAGLKLTVHRHAA